MKVRRVKRKCGVRGCKCTNTFAVARTGEIGNTVIICESCLREALDVVSGAQPAEETRRTAIPPLFFNDAVNSEEEAPASVETVEEATEEAKTQGDAFICPHCGQVCKSELGLQKHIAAKHKDEEA